MIHTIRSRLKVVEQVKKNTVVPEMVMIYWDDAKGKWIAKEQYIKRNSKGKPIAGTGKSKLISLDSPEEYQLPVGFKGVVLNEGRIID